MSPCHRLGLLVILAVSASGGLSTSCGRIGFESVDSTSDADATSDNNNISSDESIDIDTDTGTETGTDDYSPNFQI